MRPTPWLARAALVSAVLSLSSCSHVQPQPLAPAAPAGARAPAAAGAFRRPDGAPMRLTASDGTGLRLVELTGRAVVEDPLAFTELTLVFENPEDRILEGNFSITLPPGATVSRFAMKIGEAWQEGEVVEREGARRAYEDFLHRRQDPALLEQGAGNEFTARVFPIPARGLKELVLSYSQELTGDAYVLPLRGLPEVGRLDVAVTRSGERAPAEALVQTRFAPAADFVLPARRLRDGAGLRSDHLVLARVRPMADAQPDPIASAVVLVDTSASRALGFEEQVALVGRLVQRIVEAGGRGVPLSVACYDQTVEPIFEGEAGAFGEKELRRIQARQALGASDLGRALRWAGERAGARRLARVLLVSDGVATAGDVEADALRAAALGLKAAGVERLDAVAVGGIREDAALRRLVTAGLPRDGVVADGAADPATLGWRLTQATRSNVAVEVEGARWVWPRKLDGVQPGDEALVYADVPAGQPVRITVGGVTATPELRRVERPLLERAWIQAKIASLAAQEGAAGPSEAIRKEIVGLSVAHRVLGPYTALLVLETEDDYARFSIDRRALVDILTVDEGRVAVRRRSRAVAGAAGPAPRDARPAPAEDRAPRTRAPAPPEPPATAAGAWADDPIGDSFGAGGLGLTGIGEGGGGRAEGIGLGRVGTIGHGASPAEGQGFGSGHGRLGGSHRMSPPTVRMGATQVTGRLPPELVQRIVRQNFGRFRLCYESGLRANPNLLGRVTVRFTIGRDGAVTGVADGGSDLGDGGVVSCVLRSFYGLSFPAPEGGTVTVVYPILFAPGGGLQAGAPPGEPDPERPVAANPYAGRLKTVMDALAKGAVAQALEDARAYRAEAPGDVMALVGLGEALEAAGDRAGAARCYGSIVDLFPSRADMRRFAGERLERVAGLDLAADTYEKARAQRPDHPASHRLLAFALLKKGEHGKAFEAAAAGLAQRYPEGRFAGVHRILREDLGLIAAAWIHAEPAKRAEILARTAEAGGAVEAEPSLRFVLNWETDANDVDFHIHDAAGNHAYFGRRALPGGGELYDDVTTGYGPECFTIRKPKEQRSARYTLQAQYYARGPMGYGMGKLQVLDHDGKGGITFEERPFVVMQDHAFVDLGTVTR